MAAVGRSAGKVVRKPWFLTPPVLVRGALCGFNVWGFVYQGEPPQNLQIFAIPIFILVFVLVFVLALALIRGQG